MLKRTLKWCQKNLNKFNSGDSEHAYILTCGETWIYFYEFETKQQSTVWIFPFDPWPTKVVRSKNASRKIISAFFSKFGFIATVLLEDRTIKAWLHHWEEKISKRPSILRKDNASLDKVLLAMDYLKLEKIKLIIHCLYSRDLTPKDYFLFPFL